MNPAYETIIQELLLDKSSVCFDYNDNNKALIILKNIILNTNNILYILLNDLNDEMINNDEIYTALKTLSEKTYTKINIVCKKEIKNTSKITELLNENQQIIYSLKYFDFDSIYILSDMNKIQIKHDNKYYTTFNNKEVGEKIRKKIFN